MRFANLWMAWSPMNTTTNRGRDDRLVKDKDTFLGLLKRLCDNDEGFVFHNIDNDFHVMVINECTSEGIMRFSIGIAPQPNLKKILRKERMLLYANGISEVSMCDDAPLIVDQIVVSYDSPCDTDLQRAIKTVNKIYAYEICKCGENFVKDGNRSSDDQCCYVCHATAHPDDPKAFCTICQSFGVPRQMVPKCTMCKSSFHAKCWRQYGIIACPNCRQISL